MDNEKEKTSRSFYIKKNFLWQLLQNAITMLFPLIIRTLFVYKIGDEFLGLNSLCTSIVATLNVANFGMDSVLVGRMYRPVEAGDTEEICRQLNLSRTIYRVIGLVILVCGIMILPFLERFIESDMPDVNIYIVFTIYLFGTVASYWLYGYSLIVFKATQEIYYLGQNITIGFLLQYGLQILALLTHNYLLYVCFTPVSVVFYNVSTYKKLRKKYPQYMCKGKSDTETIRILRKNVVSCAVFKMRDTSRDTLDSVIISAILGLIILSKYQNYITVLLVPLTLKTVITGTITPSLGNFNVSASKKEQFELVRKLWLLEMSVSGFFSICYFQLISSFIRIWLGEERVLPLSIALILSVYLFVLGICDFFKMIRQTNLLWEKGRCVAVIEMIVNLTLNIILAKWIGLFGIVLATIVTIVCITLPYELWVNVKIYFGQDGRRFLTLMIRIILWMSLANVLIWNLANIFSFKQYISFVFHAFVSIVVAGGMFLFVFKNVEEWKSLVKILLK